MDKQKSYVWSTQKSKRIPSLWYKEINSLRLHYNAETKELGHMEGKTFVALKEDKTYGYVITNDYVFLCWPINGDSPKLEFVRPIKSGDYVGHLTAGVQSKVLKLFGKKTIQELQEYADKDRNKYEAEFVKLFDGKDDSRVLLAGEFEIELNTKTFQKTGRKYAVWRSALLDSGHYKPDTQHVITTFRNLILASKWDNQQYLLEIMVHAPKTKFFGDMFC